MAAAVARARSGGGPTLLECETYRMSHHTTADDATRYRDPKEVAAWAARDPISRFKTFLERRKLWNAAAEKKLAADTQKWIEGEIKAYEETPAPNPLNMFADNYAHAPWNLIEQRAELEEVLKFKGGAKILMELPPTEGRFP